MNPPQNSEGSHSVEQDPRPVVARPRHGPPGALLAIGVIGGGLLLTIALMQPSSESRLPPVDHSPAAYIPPPPLIVPPEDRLPAVVAPAAVRVQQPQPPLPIFQELPTMLPAIAPVRDLPAPNRPIGILPMRRATVPTESALVIDAGSGELPIGTLVAAVLETPIDTSRPGPARAIVAQDVRSVDGAMLLIPRGSHLLGEYQSDVRAGQNRVLVTWTRLLLPDGTVQQLVAPSTDQAGAAGIPGRVQSFFLARFFRSAVQTAFGAAANLAGSRTSNTVIIGLPAAANVSSGEGTGSNDSYSPRIRISAGTLFNVFITRDPVPLATAAAPPK